MSNEPLTASSEASATNSEDVAQVRRLLHDMNNGLEIIIQASYLIGMLDLPEDGKQWLKLLDQGVQQVTSLSGQLRQQIVKQQLA